MCVLCVFSIYMMNLLIENYLPINSAKTAKDIEWRRMRWSASKLLRSFPFLVNSIRNSDSWHEKINKKLNWKFAICKWVTHPFHSSQMQHSIYIWYCILSLHDWRWWPKSNHLWIFQEYYWINHHRMVHCPIWKWYDSTSVELIVSFCSRWESSTRVSYDVHCAIDEEWIDK